jgi:hypothetical protein
MINFLAEIIKNNEITVQPTPTNDYNKKYNVYELDISKTPESSYWLDWGGYYDNFVSDNIELYFEKFLTKAETLEEVMTIPFTMFIKNNDLTTKIVLLNVPRHTWLYPNYTVDNGFVSYFLSSALNPNNPSSNIINGQQAMIKLEVPNFTVKLSDNFNGITLNQGFGIKLINNEGYFDDDTENNIINTPIRLKKSTIENPIYEDFKEIRSGSIEDLFTTFYDFSIAVSDKINSLDEPLCKVIEQKNYSQQLDENAIGKNIPIVYGTKKVKLLKLSDTDYIAAENTNRVIEVYDKDNNSIVFDFNQNIIQAEQADSALIEGDTDNRIGQIIIQILSERAMIPYSVSYWNLVETENYRLNSPRINLVLSNGSIKKSIQDILKNDVAYLIQQIDGKLTLRKYGNTYGIHNIPSYMITKPPEKNYGRAQDDYFSSCIINYDFIDDSNYKSYLFNRLEGTAEQKFKRRKTRIFDTDLVNLNDVENLVKLISDRFLFMKKTIKLAVGLDTSSMELLDSVSVDLIINDREFSKANKYIIKEINPAQDILTLEEIN